MTKCLKNLTLDTTQLPVNGSKLWDFIGCLSSILKKLTKKPMTLPNIQKTQLGFLMPSDRVGDLNPRSIKQRYGAQTVRPQQRCCCLKLESSLQPREERKKGKSTEKNGANCEERSKKISLMESEKCKWTDLRGVYKKLSTPSTPLVR